MFFYPRIHSHLCISRFLQKVRNNISMIPHFCRDCNVLFLASPFHRESIGRPRRVRPRNFSVKPVKNRRSGRGASNKKSTVRLIWTVDFCGILFVMPDLLHTVPRYAGRRRGNPRRLCLFSLGAVWLSSWGWRYSNSRSYRRYKSLPRFHWLRFRLRLRRSLP